MIDHSTQHVQSSPGGARKPENGRHGLMMIACCIPMLAIAIVLVATGVVGARFIFVAVACTAMMALMMRGMDHGGMDHGRMNHEGQADAAMDRHDGVDNSGSRPLPPPPHTGRGRPNDR